MSILNLRDFRVNKSMSQREISAMLNITQAHYWKWENGKSMPNAKQILQLCEIFECTPNDLYGIKGVVTVYQDSLRGN